VRQQHVGNRIDRDHTVQTGVGFAFMPGRIVPISGNSHSGDPSSFFAPIRIYPAQENKPLGMVCSRNNDDAQPRIDGVMLRFPRKELIF